MLGRALALTLLLLLKGSQGQDAPTDYMVAQTGAHLQLRPPSTWMMVDSVEWKVQRRSDTQERVIVAWSNESGSNCVQWFPQSVRERVSFMPESFTLLINAAQRQDSGCYHLEVTNNSGGVMKFHFSVSVFDPVGEPLLLQQWKALDRGTCQVTLSCLVSGGDDVSYAWYRGRELIQASRNLTIPGLQSADEDGRTYTCNVSNPVSFASRTTTLPQDCPSAQRAFSFLPFLVAIVLLAMLSLSALSYFLVCRRQRKQSEPSPEETLTFYEQVNNLPDRNNHGQEQSPPGEGTTIYCRIQSQPPASTSQVTENTLYSLVQPSRKSESKKRKQNVSFNNTVYEEVGKRQPKAQNPARLSQKELENFRVYW